MTSFIKNKKADGTNLSLTNVIGMVIAVIVTVGLLFPVAQELWAMLRNNPDQGTHHSFEEFSKEIKELKPGEQSPSINYFIDNGFRVVGFNKNQNNVEQKCGLFDKSISRPSECGAKACLVLCDEDKDCRKSTKNSAFFEDIDNIIADTNLELNLGKNKNFVLYGNCDGFTPPHKTKIIFVKRVGNDIIISSKK